MDKDPIPVDPSCVDLAEHFLAQERYTLATKDVHAARVTALSVEIQLAVEAWFVENGKPHWYRK